MTYELSCVLEGHKGDVLGLDITSDDHIVSCSRDKTAKLWIRDKSTDKYRSVETYSTVQNVKTKSLTCVCVIPPSDIFKMGLIVTGSNDSVISIFEPDGAVPCQQLFGHSNTVSKLVKSYETNVILSSSWDATVKIWKLAARGSKCIRTIEFPQTSVWAVLHLKQKFICAGTADKIVRIFDNDGNLLRSLIGHEDCVRDLVELENDEILSCSNDATIRRWSVTTGTCLEIMYGHPNYIYSVRVFDDLIVSGGEDKCLLIWAKGHHLQTINLPDRSVWTVAFLSNRDIVVGSSDGFIRIFTTAKERQASQQTLEAFRLASINSMNPTTKYVARRNKAPRLPGLEVLKENGVREGQTKIICDNDAVILYSWSAEKNMWKKLGNVNASPPVLLETSDHSNEQEKTSTSVEQSSIFVCALCRRSFSRRYILRRHIRETNHSIANKIPSHLRSVLPYDWHYYVCKFRRKGTKFKAEICLTISTLKEVHEWIRKFSNQNQQMYRRYSTKKSDLGLTAYAEFYRCEHAFNTRKSKNQNLDGNKCKSSIHIAIRRDPLSSANYTKIMLNSAHNHSVALQKFKPSVEVKNKFRLMFENGLSPISAFCAFKEDMEAPYGSSSCAWERYHELPNLKWVKSYYRSLYGDAVEEPDLNEDLSVSSSIVQSESNLHCIKVENVDLERQSSYMEYIVPNMDDMVSEMEVECDSNDELDDQQLLRKLQERFDGFLAKLEQENLSYFKTGILSMCNELKKACHASAKSRLSALLSFNRTNEAR